MYALLSQSQPTPPDITAFLERLNRLVNHPLPAARTLFNADAPLTIARAPGRLDVMGGVADYSGSLVLEMPTREATRVALQRRRDRVIRVVSMSGERDSLFEMNLNDLLHGSQPVAYEAAQTFFQRDLANAWAAYVAGVFLVLMRERIIDFASGANILVESDVPEGKGVSSSAALEVATMMAVCAAYDVVLEPRKVALLCQTVENHVVGAPCGVMDQMTSVHGEAGKLLALLCQPAEIQGNVAIPDDLAVWGIDSGIRHAVSGADYGSVRVGAFMGRRMSAGTDRQRASTISPTCPFRTSISTLPRGSRNPSAAQISCASLARRVTPSPPSTRRASTPCASPPATRLRSTFACRRSVSFCPAASKMARCWVN